MADVCATARGLAGRPQLRIFDANALDNILHQVCASKLRARWSHQQQRAASDLIDSKSYIVLWLVASFFLVNNASLSDAQPCPWPGAEDDERPATLAKAQDAAAARAQGEEIGSTGACRLVVLPENDPAPCGTSARAACGFASEVCLLVGLPGGGG